MQGIRLIQLLQSAIVIFGFRDIPFQGIFNTCVYEKVEDLFSPFVHFSF